MSDNSSQMSFDEAIEKLSRNVYLESPGIWIDLTDKLNDKVFDEMVLFFATKYNTLPIIEYAVENNSIDLNLASQNKEYKNIGQHLISIALQSNNINIHNYLKKALGEDEDIIVEDDENFEENVIDSNLDLEINDSNGVYIPEYLCPKCNSNIFIHGYKVIEDVIYKFSSNKDRLVENNRKSMDYVTCCNCNHTINNITSENLKDLCKLQNCSKCLTNLTNVGIVDKSKMIFDNKSNRFIPSYTTFHCGKCDSEISQKQKEYFEL